LGYSLQFLRFLNFNLVIIITIESEIEFRAAQRTLETVWIIENTCSTLYRNACTHLYRDHSNAATMTRPPFPTYAKRMFHLRTPLLQVNKRRRYQLSPLGYRPLITPCRTNNRGNATPVGTTVRCRTIYLTEEKHIALSPRSN